MLAEFIEVTDRRWPQLLKSARHDFYHLQEYVALCGKHENGRPAAFYAEEDGCCLLIPLLIRSLPSHLGASSDWCDLISPYGYPCPVAYPAATVGMVQRAFEAFRRLAADHGAVTAFMRLHPLFDSPLSVFADFGELICHGETVYIDLGLPESELWSQIRKSHKNEIRRAEAAGFKVLIDHWEYFDGFVALYLKTMQRLSASETYLFSEGYFSQLRLALDSCLHMATVLAPDGGIACSGLFTDTCGIVQYHLSGSSEAYRHFATTKLMLDQVRRWAKDRRMAVFHLGGGVGSQRDSLFDFKAGFSKLRSHFHTLRMVLDAEKYAELNRRCNRGTESSVVSSGFFPLYRTSCRQI